jgi:hypothetical protein
MAYIVVNTKDKGKAVINTAHIERIKFAPTNDVMGETIAFDMISGETSALIDGGLTLLDEILTFMLFPGKSGGVLDLTINQPEEDKA